MQGGHTNGVLDLLLDPVARCLDVESAAHLAALRADPVAQQRIEDLAEASTEGTLSVEEHAEYESCVAAADFIAILQSKARLILKIQGAK
jgi:hypothetical protein